MTDPEDASDSQVSRRAALRGVASAAAAPFFTHSVAGQADDTFDPANQNDDQELIRGIRTAPGSEPSREVTVGFGSDLPPEVTLATIRYGPKGEFENNNFSTFSTSASRALPGGRYVYTFNLKLLEPDTTYKYRIAVADNNYTGVKSDVHEFSTAPAPHNVEEFTVAQFADHGVDDDSNPCNRTTNHRPRYVTKRAGPADLELPEWMDGDPIDPEFLMISGDTSYANGKPSTWEQYFEVNEDVFANVPIATAVGNHEREPGFGFQQYDGHLNQLMPTGTVPVAEEDGEAEKRRWFDVRYGNAIFITLNLETATYGEGIQFYPILDGGTGGYDQYGDDLPDSAIEFLLEGPQLEYLKETLRRASDDDTIKWKVVQFHNPMVSANNRKHPDHPTAREVWGPLFDQHNVDLVLTGDNHYWNRSRPLRNLSKEPNVSEAPGFGTTYVTNGSGGISNYTASFSDAGGESMAIRDKGYGVTKLTFDDERIEVSYVDYKTGEAVDSFDIEKDEQGRPVQRPDPGGESVRALNYKNVGAPGDENTGLDGDDIILRSTTPPEYGTAGGTEYFGTGQEVCFEFKLEKNAQVPSWTQYRQGPNPIRRPPNRVRIHVPGDFKILGADSNEDIGRVERIADDTVKYIYLWNSEGGPKKATVAGTATFKLRLPRESSGGRYYALAKKGLTPQVRDPAGRLNWTLVNDWVTGPQSEGVRIVGPDGTYNEDNCANRF
jgi:hypothetical protein